MDVQVNWLAILLATLSTMIVGSIWYTPKVFGNSWMKLTHQDKRKDKPPMWQPVVATLIVSLITAYVLAHVIYLSHQFFQNSFLQDSLMTAFWVWLGFTAARFVTHDAFEGRPTQLTLMNIAHELVTYLVMGLVIGLIGIS